MELLDDCYQLRWYSDASEYLPQEGAVNGVVRLLEVYEEEYFTMYVVGGEFQKASDIVIMKLMVKTLIK